MLTSLSVFCLGGDMRKEKADVNVSIRMTRSLYLRLKALADSHKWSVSKLIKKLLEEVTAGEL